MIHNSLIQQQLSQIWLYIRNELNYCRSMLLLFGLLRHKQGTALLSFRKNYDQVWSTIHILENGKGHSTKQ